MFASSTFPIRNPFTRDDNKARVQAIVKKNNERFACKELIIELREFETNVVDKPYDEANDHWTTENINSEHFKKLKEIVDKVEYGYIPAEEKSEILCRQTIAKSHDACKGFLEELQNNNNNKPVRQSTATATAFVGIVSSCSLPSVVRFFFFVFVFPAMLQQKNLCL